MSSVLTKGKRRDGGEQGVIWSRMSLPTKMTKAFEARRSPFFHDSQDQHSLSFLSQ